MRRPGLRSTTARAVAPVVAGIGFFAVLGLILFGIAAVMSGEQAQTTTFTPDRLQVGNVERWAETVETNGPVLFPGLGTTSGERTIVLDHNGSDPQRGWIVYYAYPADRDAPCAVVQLEGTENRITVARNRYIKAVQEYNVLARQFPSNLTAMVFGYAVKPSFSVQNEAAISAPPAVSFDKGAAPAAPAASR